MDFSLTDEQELLRDTARTLLANECPPSLVRAHIDDPAAADVLWETHLSNWVALADGPVVDQCLFAEELGATLAPGPFWSTASLFAPLARAAGLGVADEVVAGRLSGTVAMAGADGTWQLNDDPVRTFVAEADRVDLVAFVLPGPAVLVVEAADLEHRAIDTLDTTRRFFALDVPAGAASSSDVVAVDAAALAHVLDVATLTLAAELVGVARWLVDHSVDYAKERIQFDKPIGSFQGLQWKLVDMALDHQRATAAVNYAAMTVDADDPDRRRAVHVAKAAAGTAARHGARDGMQVHGGIGYTYEHDLHLYLRKAYTDDYLFGDTAWHHDRLADLLLDG